ncbi:Uncharacterised protein [Mycobacteroides abscessus subsp. massiliense]|nr:Uncharacterised protein [Mycobacteroides abscessus subsp. massiliense]
MPCIPPPAPPPADPLAALLWPPPAASGSCLPPLFLSLSLSVEFCGDSVSESYSGPSWPGGFLNSAGSSCVSALVNVSYASPPLPHAAFMAGSHLPSMFCWTCGPIFVALVSSATDLSPVPVL